MRYLLVAVAAFLSGCAAPVFQVPLSMPQALALKPDHTFTVKDGRLDRQIYMTGISFCSASHIYLLLAEPPLDVVLKSILDEDPRQKALPLTQIVMDLTIEELDIKSKIGFGRPHELYCKIESSLSLHSTLAAEGELRVKTFSRNDESTSPMVVTIAKTILDQCLRQHAADISRAVEANHNVRAR